MKPTSQIIIFVLAIVTSMASAQAQSPREQLSQMVEQLQKTPTDNTLREKIIKLAQGVKPAPAIPDKAIEYEGRAQFAFKSAKSEADFLAAAREYENAIAAAPWVPGYYADLCTIYEKAGRFEDAKRNCEFYLVGLTDPAQMTDVKRRIAGLTFGIEKAGAEKALAAKQQADATRAANAAEERKKNSIEGYWFFAGNDNVPESTAPMLQIERVGAALVVKPNQNEDFYSYGQVQITETSLSLLISPTKSFFMFKPNRLTLHLRDGALVGTQTIIEDGRTKHYRLIRKPWPAK